MKILVLDVPGLHLGYLGCYGNDWVGTPNIDRFASGSVVFDRHYFSASPDDGGLRSELEVSQESLQQTVANIVEPGKDRKDLIRACFPSLAPPWNLPDDLLNSYCEEEDQPWPDPPHGPLENPDDLLRLQNTYAAVVTTFDAHLGDLFDSLREQKKYDDLLICLTSPFGLPLGEHGFIGYSRPEPYEEFVHLPLLLKLPQSEFAGLRLSALTQPDDLMPTFLEFLGGAFPSGSGQSLWPLIRGEANQVRDQICSRLRVGNEETWALRTQDWAFILPVSDAAGVPRLFVKPEDRWEVNDVRQHNLDLADEMEKKLRLIYRFALAGSSERETINQGSAKR